MEFPKVVKVITQLIGVDDATEDDVEDIFNLLDVNGDQSLDRKELESLFRVFFKMLEERDIQVVISNDSDIVENPSWFLYFHAFASKILKNHKIRYIEKSIFLNYGLF